MGYFENIDKEGKKDIKLELYSLLVCTLARFHITMAYLIRIEVALHEMSAKVMFLHVQIDSYFTHPLIFAQPSAQKLAFFAPLLFSRTSPVQKLKGLRYSKSDCIPLGFAYSTKTKSP